jgi:hypothetical protein
VPAVVEGLMLALAAIVGDWDCFTDDDEATFEGCFGLEFAGTGETDIAEINCRVELVGQRR